MVCAAAALAVAPAEARRRELQTSLSSTGSVAVTWHGDAARGCASAGLCGYRGSTSMRPSNPGELFLTYSNGRLVDTFGTLDSQAPSVARVQRTEADGGTGACVDVSEGREVDVFASRPRNGRVRLGLGGGGLQAGRCAGPDLAGVLSRLPERRVSVSRLGYGRTTIDLSARVPFSRGRFSGTLVSTLRLHVGRPRSTRAFDDVSSPPGSHRGRLKRVVDVHAVYRVTGFAGKLTASSHGLAAPLCTAVDSCGVSGSANWAIRSGAGAVVIDASALARRSDHGLRGALAAIRRRGSGGFVEVGTDLRQAVGTTNASVTRAGAAPCADTKSTPAPYLSSRQSRTAISLALGDPGDYVDGPDVLRTGCPGPTQSGVFARRAIATGTAPLLALAQRRIDMQLRADGQFYDGGYAGVWRSRFRLGLRRVDERVTYRLVPVLG
jgi:hypothetical protein